MLAGRRIAVVMPAYNEAKLIRGSLEAIPSFVDHIIVVDDASMDATRETARAFGGRVELIEHESNQGVGAAIGTGCRHAFLLGADFTAVMAADGQMDPADLPALSSRIILPPTGSGVSLSIPATRMAAVLAQPDVITLDPPPASL